LSTFARRRPALNDCCSASVLVIYFLIGLGSARAETWVKLGHYETRGLEWTEYISAEKVITRDGYVQLWALTDYEVVQKKLDWKLLESAPSNVDPFTLIFDEKPSIYVKQYKSMPRVDFCRLC
jgi:hypothetical protein